MKTECRTIAYRVSPLSLLIADQEHSVKSSASTAHTAYASGGTALPAGQVSRAAGATLDAARPGAR